MLKARYRQILWFFARVLLNLAFWDIFLPHVGFRRLARSSRSRRLQQIARAFRAQAVQLGGVMIKVGQFLSARLDVLPREITDELAGLQDEVGAESFDDIRKVLEAEFAGPISAHFGEINPFPVASASIGQVHAAKLLPSTGMHGANEPESLQAVVIKVQRPLIEEIVKVDLTALSVVGKWLNRYAPIRKRANVPGLLKEFSQTLNEEIDYLHEAQNAETFAKNFENREDVCVPRVVRSHTTRRVLTLEDVQSIKITDYPAIEAAGIDRAEVANRLFDTYLKQIFEDRFFHADPHPGNLFVHPLGAPQPGQKTPFQLVFVDFGMAGVILPDQLTGLRELLIGLGTQDSARVVKSYQALDILLPGADLSMLEKGTSRVFERFWGKTAPQMMTMHQEEAVAFAREFGELIYDLPFQVPENMILLARCVGILSGICTGLYADFNVWTGLAPYAAKLVQAEGGAGLQFWLKEIVTILQVLISLPRKTEALFNKLEQGRLEIHDPLLSRQVSRLGRSVNRISGSVIFAAFLLGGVQLYLAGQLVLAAGLGLAALAALAWILISR